MELEDLKSFVLLVVLVGMVIGIGVVVTEKFGSLTFYDVDNVNVSTALTANNTALSLGFGNITSVYSVKNATDQNNFDSTCYVIDQTNGTIKLTNTNNATCSTAIPKTVTTFLKYRTYDTQTSRAMKASYTEIAGIGTNWLGLIVTVAILSLVLFLVVRSFGGQNR